MYAAGGGFGCIKQRGIVNPDSNYCFGEGRPVLDSDSKLYTRGNKRGSIDRILKPVCTLWCRKKNFIQKPIRISAPTNFPHYYRHAAANFKQWCEFCLKKK